MKERRTELERVAHIVILITYTFFSLILTVVSILLKWEGWVLPVIIVGVLASWWLHLFGIIPENRRVWVYSILMMQTFFYYGIHRTSMYDIAVVMLVVIMIFTMTASRAMIIMCEITYMITMGYNIICAVQEGSVFDTLTVCRIILHVSTVIVAGCLAAVVIKKWELVFGKTDEWIDALLGQSRRMDEFLANLSHEIRTPINAVTGLSDVMLKREENDDIRQDLIVIHNAGKRVTDQISDVLDYTEIDMDKLRVNNENYMISGVINDVISQLRPLFKPGVELVVDVDAAIPTVLVGDTTKIKKIIWHLVRNSLKFTEDGGIYLKIRGIPKSYGINLCIEVRDSGIGIELDEQSRIFESFYQADSGIRRKVGGLGLGLPIVYGFTKAMDGFLSVESIPGQGTSVRVSIPQHVEDTRDCAYIEDREKYCIAAFWDFEAISNYKIREFYNLMIQSMVNGLKLNVHWVKTRDDLVRLQGEYTITHVFVGSSEYVSNRDYMELLSGYMTVAVIAVDDIELPEGSAVKLLRKPFHIFPVADLLSGDSTTAVRQEEGGVLRCRGIRAFVVDDEPMNLFVAKGILEDYGMTVATAASGEEAIRTCQENEYDLVFLDYMMPKMDGIETMKRLRGDAVRQGKNFSIIALTANTISSAKSMFISEGFDAFLPKPIETVELERVLKKHLPKGAITYERADLSPRKKPAAGQEKKPAVSKVTLRDISGLDVEKGLSYCKNDADFYHVLLLQYASDAPAKTAELSGYVIARDWRNYEIKIHALKSSSLMIGATGLSERARELENAAKGGFAEMIISDHQNVMEEYNILAENIMSKFGEPYKEEEEKEEGYVKEPEEEPDILEFEGGEMVNV